jgi:hypothetical protein
VDLFYSVAIGNGHYDALFPMIIGIVEMRIDNTVLFGLKDENKIGPYQIVMNRTVTRDKYANLEK